ncbi:MAG TPA: hypothetical protein VKV15_23050 [Bryobacteraceae bacterium]|nr:hypothetical protein [Bryobacteraceae bacterium]
MKTWSCCSALALALFAAGCSSNPPAQKTPSGAVPLFVPSAVSVQHHPLGKYLELAGFRIDEQGVGKLKIRFAVINHSDGDITDLGLKVTLKSITAKPGEPPICTFEVKVPDIGPEEMKEVTGTAATKLRVYELPDWQYMRSDFEIASPPAS